MEGVNYLLDTLVEARIRKLSLAKGTSEEGKETAVKFYEEHVAEVKKVVPEEKLLVWEVRMSYSITIAKSLI